MKKTRTLSGFKATISIPGSKSITHRALIIASLAKGESVLRNFLECEDTHHTMNVLRLLGVKIHREGRDLRIEGSGGRLGTSLKRTDLYVGNSGTSFRLLLSTIALGRGEYLLTGTERMLQRPVGPLVKALKRLGVDAVCVKEDGFPPVLIHAKGIRGGKAVVEGGQSSQFISSLLLSAPYAESDTKIEVKGDLVSRPYVDITINVMKQFGVEIQRDGYSFFKVPFGPKYRPREFVIQGDASSASYFWAAAAVTGGTVTTKNIHPYTTTQGDIGFIEILERMGCGIEKIEDRVVVRGGKLVGIEADLGAMPDLVPTLAAVALFARGKTIIRNVSHLRYKESDRLRAVALEWARLGGRVEERDDGLIIHGEDPLLGTIVDPHDDHRLAMSLAVVGLRVPGIRIKDEECVNKSFPGFWELWDTNRSE